MGSVKSLVGFVNGLGRSGIIHQCLLASLLGLVEDHVQIFPPRFVAFTEAGILEAGEMSSLVLEPQEPERHAPVGAEFPVNSPQSGRGRGTLEGAVGGDSTSSRFPSSQPSGSGHVTPASSARRRKAPTVLREILRLSTQWYDGSSLPRIPVVGHLDFRMDNPWLGPFPISSPVEFTMRRNGGSVPEVLRRGQASTAQVDGICRIDRRA